MRTRITEEAFERARRTVLTEFHVLELWMPQLTDDKNCNLRCKHCYVPAGGMTKPTMTPSEYAEALRGMANRPEFNRMGRFDVVFPGMEPLLPRNKSWFRPLIDEAVKLNKGSIGITTNGTLLNNETVEFLGNTAAKIAYPFTVNVSLDGDEATHDLQRGGKGLWKKATGGIRRLARAGCCNLVTNTTITTFNSSSLHEIARISSDCGAKIAAFHPFETAINSNLHLVAPADLVQSIHSLIESFHRDHKLKYVVLEFEASSAGTFFRLFETGIFEGWELVEDETGFLFLRDADGDRQLLINLMFHPHHFIRTMRLLHNGGFASCRTMALHGWETVGNWRMSLSDLKEACIPCLAEIWQEYLDSTIKISAQTFEQFNQLILKGGT